MTIPSEERKKHVKSQSQDIELGNLADSEMREFFEQVEQVKNGIKKISQNATDLDKVHRQALTAVNPTDIAVYTKKAENIMEENKVAVRSTRKLLKDMERANVELMAAQPKGSADIRMRTCQYSQLAKRLVQVMNSFQSVQVNYKTKQRQQLQRQYLIVKPQASQEELDKLVDSEDGQEMLSQVFSMSTKAEARKTLAELQERHQDIMMIEKSILELHQLFVDMSVLVEQQGDLIDQIECHVGQAAEYTGEAAVQLEQAVKYQKSALKKKWILIIILLFIVGAIVGFIVYTQN